MELRRYSKPWPSSVARTLVDYPVCIEAYLRVHWSFHACPFPPPPSPPPTSPKHNPIQSATTAMLPSPWRDVGWTVHYSPTTAASLYSERCDMYCNNSKCLFHQGEVSDQEHQQQLIFTTLSAFEGRTLQQQQQQQMIPSSRRGECRTLQHQQQLILLQGVHTYTAATTAITSFIKERWVYVA